MRNRRMMKMVEFIVDMLNDLVELEVQEYEAATEFIEFCGEDEDVDADLILDRVEADAKTQAIFAWNRAIERGISEEILEPWFERAGYII